MSSVVLKSDEVHLTTAMADDRADRQCTGARIQTLKRQMLVATTSCGEKYKLIKKTP